MSFAGRTSCVCRALRELSFANLGHPLLLLKGMDSKGDASVVGILRFAQNDGFVS
jgi:hypothetical protein